MNPTMKEFIDNYNIAEAARAFYAAREECRRIGNYAWDAMDEHDRERGGQEMREAILREEEAQADLWRAIEKSPATNT
jgi:hypothetical protein